MDVTLMGLGRGKPDHNGPRDMARKDGHWGETHEAKAWASRARRRDDGVEVEGQRHDGKEPRTVYEIDGRNFESLDGFFEELGRTLPIDVGWAQNLDALDDMLSGGWGTPGEGFVIRWRQHELSRKRLGYPETLRQLEIRLERCHPTNRASVEIELEAARRQKGETVFDWLVEIIRSHGPGGVASRDGVLLELA